MLEKLTITKMAREEAIEFLQQNYKKAEEKAKNIGTRKDKEYAAGYSSAIAWIEEMHAQEQDYMFFVHELNEYSPGKTNKSLRNIFKGYRDALEDNLGMIFKVEANADEIEDEGVDMQTLEDFSLLDDAEGEY